MIPGIVASEYGAPTPIVANGTFDFVAGVYDWLGTPLSAAQVTDKTAWIGVNGLTVPASQPAGAKILYAATKTFLAASQFTAVFEVELTATPFAEIFTMSNSGDSFYAEVTVDPTIEWDIIDNDGSVTGSINVTNAVALGIHKVAVNRANSERSISAGGFASATDTSSVTLPVIGFPMVNFFLGGWSDHTSGTIRIRSVAFYDVQLASSLPSLSS
jgi:hypothetical protein